MADKLFGTLHTPLKPINYTGVDTDTISIVVDAADRTISANLKSQILSLIDGNATNLETLNYRIRELRQELETVDQLLKELDFKVNSDIANLNNIKVDLTNADTNLSNQLIETNSTLSAFKAEVQGSYATKHEVDEKIDEKILELEGGSINLETYVKKDDFEDAIDTIQNTYLAKTDAEDTYLKIITAENTYAKKTDITEFITEDNLNGYATEAYVEQKLTNLDIDIDLSNYYTKTEVDGLFEEYKPEAGDVNLDNYYTKDEVDYLLPDLSAYYTQDEIDDKLDSIIAGDADLSNYYTKDEADAAFISPSELEEELSKIDISDISLDNYYTKTEITELLAAIDLIEPDISLAVS